MAMLLATLCNTFGSIFIIVLALRNTPLLEDKNESICTDIEYTKPKLF